MTDSFWFFFSFIIPCPLWSAALVLIVLAVRSHRVYVDISVQPMSFFTELRHYYCPPNGFHMKRNCSKPSQWQRWYGEVAGVRPALLSGWLPIHLGFNMQQQYRVFTDEAVVSFSLKWTAGCCVTSEKDSSDWSSFIKAPNLSCDIYILSSQAN